jgi:hypothetical protein
VKSVQSVALYNRHQRNFRVESNRFSGGAMSKAEINSGICGHITAVKAKMEGKVCKLTITSDCKAIEQLAQELKEVNPLMEISCKRATPQTLQMGLKHCYHAACPVPVGIIKAVEVEAKLALPKDVLIKVSKDQ